MDAFCMIAPLDYSSPESRPLLRVLLRVSSSGMLLLCWVLQGRAPDTNHCYPFGADIKLAGSLSLMISLPTMIVGFSRYTNADAFQILRKEKNFCVDGHRFRYRCRYWGLMLGMFPVRVLMTLLGAVLLISAIKTFKHTRQR